MPITITDMCLQPIFKWSVKKEMRNIIIKSTFFLAYNEKKNWRKKSVGKTNISPVRCIESEGTLGWYKRLIWVMVVPKVSLYNIDQRK